MSSVNHQPNVVACFEKLIQKTTQQSSVNKTVEFKTRAYKKVLKDVLTVFRDTPLISISQVKNRPGYGKGTLQRIEEIMNTGTLKELDEHSEEDASTHAVTALMKITGIGPVKAKKIMENGGTLEKLRTFAQEDDTHALHSFKLTHHQRLGLKYYDDLQHRIPHSVIERFDALLQQQCRKKNLPCTAIICGSYRRKNDSSGDIDVLLTREDWQKENQAEACLKVVLAFLSKHGYLVDHLTSINNAKTKYMGFLCIPDYPHVCRIDMRAVVYTQHVPALAYFTGSGEENVRLRGIASKRNMKLNEYGLMDMTSNEMIVLDSEKHLYDILDEEYVPPHKR